jgi:hypothetical protein
MSEPDGVAEPGAPGSPPTWSSRKTDAMGTSHDGSCVRTR